MDYKKKYENALEWARQVINGECGFIRKEVEEVFPELKESENERIRKGMLQGFKDYGEPEYVWFEGVKVKECIAWLEGQGKQKTADEVEPKFHEGEWITNGDYTWKIIEVKPLDYILQSQNGNVVDDTISHVDEQFHSFTPPKALLDLFTDLKNLMN
jgi:hypothetical protein